MDDQVKGLLSGAGKVSLAAVCRAGGSASVCLAGWLAVSACRCLCLCVCLCVCRSLLVSGTDKPDISSLHLRGGSPYAGRTGGQADTDRQRASRTDDVLR